jgi:hypothetical protein
MPAIAKEPGIRGAIVETRKAFRGLSSTRAPCKKQPQSHPETKKSIP